MEALALAARLLAAVCILVTLLPLLRLRAWWIRIWDFPRQQVALLALVAGACLALAGEPPTPGDALLLLALAAALAWQVAHILPYTPLWPRQARATHSEPRRRIRLLVVNVLMTNRESLGLAASIAASSLADARCVRAR